MEQVEAPAPRRMSKRPIAVITRDLRYLRENGPGCVHCREHELKCTGERPQCAACVSIDKACKYEEPAQTTPVRAAAAAAAASTSRKRPAPTSTYAQIKESRQRKRAAAAQTSCDFCRNDLRRKCDGLRPSCQSCIKRGEPCVYSGPASIPMTASTSTASYPHLPSEGEESDVVMPSRPHTPDVLPTESPTTPLDSNRPRYPQGNGLGHAGSTRNPDGTNCTRPVACFFCIKVELPCTGDFPTCVNCVRRNLQCAYPEPASYAHQFPRQSAMHTRQKDATPHRGGTSNTHPSPTRGQPTIHPSRSHPGPLNQTGLTPPPINASANASPDSRHNRQRSMSGPNGLPPGFGVEAIRSPIDNVPRSTSGPRSSISATSPSRPPAPSHTHSRNSSTSGRSPGQSTLTNPIPLPTPVPRSTAQSPPGLSPPQPKTWTPSTPQAQPLQQPRRWSGQNEAQGEFDRAPAKLFKPPESRDHPMSRPPYPSSTTTERVIGDVRAPPGDASSPVNGVIVSPSGRTRDASLIHAKANSGSNGPIDGFVHEGPASYRARMSEGEAMGSSVGSTTGRPITDEPGQITDVPLQNGNTSPNRSRPTSSRDDQAQGPADVGPNSMTNSVNRQEEKEVNGSRGPAKNGNTERPVLAPSDGRLPLLPDSVPRRPSGPSPVAQHPARDLSIIAPMGRSQDTNRRDSAAGRYDPRRDVGVREERRDSGPKEDRRDSVSTDKRGSTAVNNWQPAPRSNTRPRPVPLNSTRRDQSPHTPRSQNQPLPPPASTGQIRERSPPPSRKSGSPSTAGTGAITSAGAKSPQDVRSQVGARRRSQSPRGLYLRAESGSIRSSPMDMDSS
ncbi:Fungal Zn(2)-Cys(6) binuclear cluster domain [Ceratobasidium sp. AG-Ba]|nr:Fungal Zn(2)-Cys(6) binuclear cluster domain [Ceratobasidium sp. AG-Ba]